MKKDALIQGYFNHTLSDEELQQFQKYLEMSSDFKLEFETYKDLHLALKHHETETLKTHLKALENDIPLTKTHWYTKPLWRYAIASIIVIALCYTFFFRGSEDLYNTYFDVYPNVYQPVVRGDTPTANNTAFMAYEKSDFNRAVEAFGKSLESDNNSNIRFYYAMSLMNSGNITKAQHELETLSTLDFKFKTETRWYLTLLYLKLENYDKAKGMLQELNKTNPQFKIEERKLLLQKLSKD